MPTTHRFRPQRIILALIAAAAIGLYAWLFAGLPDARITPAHLQPPSVRILDRSGRLLYEDLPETGGRHQNLPFDQIPLLVRQATIATEDSHFYSNPGVDLLGIVRAAWINLQGGQTLAGGSTITQQVARNLLMDERERNERSLRRKLRESVLAWQLTRRYSKDEILGLYINQSYYGALSYGIEAAAQTYFGKPAAQLSLAETALLVGLPQAPSAYNPYSSPQGALQRRASVLALMEKSGAISAEQRLQAEREPLSLASAPYPMRAPHFSLMVRAAVDGLFSPAEISASGGLTVQTTLDLDAQQAAEQAITRQMERLREQGQRELGYNVNNAALVALDPHSGAILAMVGSPDYQDAAHNGAINMALVPRQPGSALKPIIYAAAFDPTRPHPWTPATALMDVETHFVTHDNLSYTPANYDGQEHGPVLARTALASSLNIPAVLTLKDVGIPGLLELCDRLGLPLSGTPEQYDLSIALGGGDVRLLDLTAAYGALASGGYRVEPYAIQSIQDAGGQVRYQHSASPPRRVLDERVAWLISDILSDDGARKIGFGLHSVLNVDRPAAVKTGTTTNFHDNWTIGYTPNLVVGVWAGNASHESMRDVNGLTGAAPIWHAALRSILAGKPAREFVRPAGLVQVEVCALSGLLPGPACPYRRREWFISGTQPTTTDTFYRPVILDSATGRLAGDDTPTERRVERVALDLPPSAQHWARANGLLLLSDLQNEMMTGQAGGMPPGDGATTQPEHSGLRISSPASLSIYQISRAMPLADQRILLEALAPAGMAQVTIVLDGEPLASLTDAPYQVWWTLAPGTHEVWAEATGPGAERISSPRIRFTVNAPE